MKTNLNSQIMATNNKALQSFKRTDFIERLVDYSIFPGRLMHWAIDIYPTVLMFTDSLEANMKRAEKVSTNLAQEMKNQLDEEREHNRIWENFMTSIGINASLANRVNSSNNSVNVLNNWLWTVNSNSNYSIEEGIASIYAVEAVLLPLTRYSLDGILCTARKLSSNADTRWFRIHTEAQEIKHAQKGLAFLGKYDETEKADKILSSISTTQKYFFSTFQSS